MVRSENCKEKPTNFKQQHLEHKGFLGTIKYSKEDKCFFGKVTNLKKDAITYQGHNLEELAKDFKGAIEDYLYITHKKYKHNEYK